VIQIEYTGIGYVNVGTKAKEILDALKIEILEELRNNSVVKKISFERPYYLLNQEVLAKLSEVMKCNKSVESLIILRFERGLLRERLFATMATSGGWSSIQELVLGVAFLSLREAKHLSSFIIQSENLRTLTLGVAPGDETGPIMETLA